jgi:hypothetical protein
MSHESHKSYPCAAGQRLPPLGKVSHAHYADTPLRPLPPLSQEPEQFAVGRLYLLGRKSAVSG